MKLYNTLTRSVEPIKPLQPPTVTVYTCGPTVYDFAHIGHWFTYVRADTLIRALKLSGLTPKWVMNITDVGHLVSDADDGEDKLEKGAKREGKTAWEIAEFYTHSFLTDMKSLNITAPTQIVKATDHIAEQVALIQKLESKGYTYIIDDGVYYDTSKFEGYAAFAQLDLDEQQGSGRVAHNPQKRQVADFALWKFNPTDHQRDMEWWAPWPKPDQHLDESHPLGMRRGADSSEMQGAGEQQTEPYQAYGEGAAEAATPQITAVRGSWGFPGWHIECSAMSMKYLGDTLDIHTGGIDHVPVHHTNEIDQSEAATGKRFANTWMHSNHVMIEGEKISKSLGNGIRLQEVIDRGISPEALRLHVLESHYRSQSKFSWDSLQAAQNRLKTYQAFADLLWELPASSTSNESIVLDAQQDILTALQDDLDTPKALARLSGLESQWLQVLSSTGKPTFKAFLTFLDDLFGLRLAETKDITDKQYGIVHAREEARKNKDWAKSDQFREQLVKQGIGLRDTADGAIWYRM